MNISVIERMIADGDLSLDALRYLLSCKSECEWLDYKLELHTDSDASAAAFSKDVLAMKNVGGGYLVLGVQDKTWIPVGLKNRIGSDAKILRDVVRRCTGLDLELDIVQHDNLQNAGTGLFAVILVRGTTRRKKRRTPSLIKDDFFPKEKYGLRRGEIYVRRGDSTERVRSQEELEDILERLNELADESAMAADQPSLPFAVLDGTYRLLEKGFDAYVGRSDLREAILESVVKDPRIWIIDVHGPGGVGKSALVNWTVYELYESQTFEAILQLSAKDTVLTTKGIQVSPRSLYSLENLLDHILNLFDEPIPESLDEKRQCAIELLNAWKTLLVLDNMETVQDGRILKFVQDLPATTKAKVLLTSRHKTGGWELPIPVTELSETETKDFVVVKSQETGTTFPITDETIKRVWQRTGGLPLAIQWTIGRFKLTRRLDLVLDEVDHRDSPILEFSFRNIWALLSQDAKSCLAILSIFDSPPDIQQLFIATNWQIEKLEGSLSELSEVTLVTPNTQASDGKTVYVALPITLSFAKHELNEMGEWETLCRKRTHKYKEQMELQQWEVSSFKTIFDRFGLSTDNEKRAAILCRRAESENLAGNLDNATLLYQQARQTAPNSAYVFATSAAAELNNGRIGRAIDFIKTAKDRVTKKTGALVYGTAARIAEAEGNKSDRLGTLQKALEFDPANLILRHQYGVALSKSGRTPEAVDEFSKIVTAEEVKDFPTDTLIIALQTRIMNLRRLDRNEEAAADLKRAREIVERFPHLKSMARMLSDLDE